MVFGDLGNICVGFVFSLLLFIRDVWTTKNADRMPPEKVGLWGLERHSHLKAVLHEAGCKPAGNSEMQHELR